METYSGHVRTPTDAIILFEACRIGLLPRVQRRLSEKERQSIKSGSVFVWDEREAGMRRWTDGKSWSASRVSGSFLTYREMEGKRSGSAIDRSANRDGVQGQDGDSDGGPDGYRYKPDGLMKQSFSIKTQQGQHLHLISYFTRSSATGQNLMQPSNDLQLRHIRPEKGMYPDSTVHEQSNIPAVTRGPMHTPGYAQSPQQPSPYVRQPSYGAYGPPSWAPPSPMHTPPPHGAYSPYPQQQPYPGHSPMQTMHYPPPPNAGYPAHPPSTPYDRPPPMPMQHHPPPQPYHHPVSTPTGYPAAHPSYPPPPQYHNGYPFPPTQGSAYQQPTHPGYEAKPQQEMYHPAHAQHHDPNVTKAERQDSHHAAAALPHHLHREQQAQVAAPPPPAPSTGQTIPSISAMLNGGGEDGRSPPRSGNRSPGGTLTVGLDIPSHKLGFEANRDMQALRNLDKTTFKQY